MDVCITSLLRQAGSVLLETTSILYVQNVSISHADVELFHIISDNEDLLVMLTASQNKQDQCSELHCGLIRQKTPHQSVGELHFYYDPISANPQRTQTLFSEVERKGNCTCCLVFELFHHSSKTLHHFYWLILTAGDSNTNILWCTETLMYHESMEQRVTAIPGLFPAGDCR